MQTRRMLGAGVALMFAGCAQFQNQTAVSEPHGVVVVADQTDLPGETGRVKKLDGLPVKSGQNYRVRPGQHEVTIQFVLTGVETSRPFVVGAELSQPAVVDVSQSGQMSVSGQNPLGGMQPVILNAETRNRFSVTNLITVEAGWLYELDGDHVTRRRVSE